MGLDGSRLALGSGRPAARPTLYGGGLDLLDRKPDLQSERKKRKRLSPLLDQIIHGGPSTTLDVSRVTRELRSGLPFFATGTLNRCIIFKYPNFDVEISAETAADYAETTGGRADKRPVETAIYIPHDDHLPQDGGYAIYIRQKRAEELLKRHLGVSADAPSEAARDDLRKLKLIDEIPSLDPFLLKMSFKRERIDINPAYLAMEEREEAVIKRVIGDRVEPIVAKALGAEGAIGAEQARRFVQAIWDPTLPEATLFIDALRIDRSEAGTVLGAWKGIAFYQNQFTHRRQHIAEVLKWFKSAESIPLDLLQNRHFHEQQLMYKAAIHRKILNLVAHIAQVFRDFDECYVAFVEHGDPGPLRSFLLSSHSRYWVMGYCCSALGHCRNLFERYLRAGLRGRVTFEQLNEMLTNMDGALRSQSEAMPVLG